MVKNRGIIRTRDYVIVGMSVQLYGSEAFQIGLLEAANVPGSVRVLETVRGEHPAKPRFASAIEAANYCWSVYCSEGGDKRAWPARCSSVVRTRHYLVVGLLVQLYGREDAQIGLLEPANALGSFRVVETVRGKHPAKPLYASAKEAAEYCWSVYRSTESIQHSEIYGRDKVPSTFNEADDIHERSKSIPILPRD